VHNGHTKPSICSVIALTFNWYPECILDHFQNLTNSCLVDSLHTIQISWNSTHCFLSYSENKQTYEHVNTLSLPTHGGHNDIHKPHDVPRDREMSSRRWSRRCSVTAVRAFNSLPKLVKILAQDSGIKAQVYAKFFVSSLAAGSANNATSCLSLSAQISSSFMNCLPRRPLFTHGWPTYINKPCNSYCIIFLF